MDEEVESDWDYENDAPLEDDGFCTLLEYLQDPEYGGKGLSAFKLLVDSDPLYIDEKNNEVFQGKYYYNKVSISPYPCDNTHPYANLIWELLDICDTYLRKLTPYVDYTISFCFAYTKPWMTLLDFDSPEMESCLSTALTLYGPMDEYCFEESLELVKPIVETSFFENYYTLRILNLAYLLYTDPQAVKEAFENDIKFEKETIQRNNDEGYFTYLLQLLENRCNEHPLPPEDDDEEDLDD